jgi:hypothetical protein
MTVPERPCSTDNIADGKVREKSKPGCTVSWADVVRVVPNPVPMIVRV